MVHVCRRWRHVIFASPRHLNLTLFCTARTPARESLDIWPPIPIALYFPSYEWRDHNENIIAAMGRPNRITDIRLEGLTIHDCEQLTWMMESPFPALTYLSLRGHGIPHPSKIRSSATCSWADLCHLYEHSSCAIFNFLRYRSCFCPPLNLSHFSFLGYQPLAVFHFHCGRWSPAWLHCQI